MREGSFSSRVLGAARWVDQALWAVIMQAYVHGVSTRTVDDLVRALGVDAGVSKSTVSRICVKRDEQVEAFRSRRLDSTAFLYVFSDATYVKARCDGREVSRAGVIASGVAADGAREVLASRFPDAVLLEQAEQPAGEVALRQRLISRGALPSARRRAA